MSLMSWFKGTSTNRVYTVSDVTDDTKRTGPLPVAINSGGAAWIKAEDSAHVSGDWGIPAWGVKNLANSTFGGADLDYTPIALTTRGSVISAHQYASLSDASSASVTGLADGGDTARLLATLGMQYNGSTKEFIRGNLDATFLASAARTATPTKVDQTNHNGRSLIVVIDCTVYPAAASVVFTIQGKDVLSGKYYTILASPAIVGVGTTVLRVGPFYPADVANSVKIDTVPRTWSIDAVHGNADSITYSVGYSIGL